MKSDFAGRGIRFVNHEVRLLGRRLIYCYYVRKALDRRRNTALLEQARKEWLSKPVNRSPLVSVRIPTYNRASVMAERTIPSVLRQTYQHFEIVIVGDHCTDETEEMMASFNDKRIRFYNLPERGRYPSNPRDRWMVAGVVPVNKATELCSGEWIAPLDDDDEFSEDHIEILLNHALARNYEMVYGVVQMERAPGLWVGLGAAPLRCGGICHLSVLYHSKLKFFKYDLDSWKYGEPADWNLWRRMKEAGVRVGFVEKVVGRHYLEKGRPGI